LAFIAAIQFLPPKQRAVLILRDVLGWTAKEAAEGLGDSVGAVTSALQRARAGVERARPRASTPAENERALVKRFMAGWEAVEVGRWGGAWADAAVMTRPPERMGGAGARAMGDFFASVPRDGRLDEIRLVPTAANQQPTLAAYARSGDGKHTP